LLSRKRRPTLRRRFHTTHAIPAESRRLTAEPLVEVEGLQPRRGITVIRCAGELDMSSCAEVREAIDWSFTPDLETLRLDLTAVTFFDSCAVRCLAGCLQHCRELGVALELLPSAAVTRVLRLVGFEQLGGLEILTAEHAEPA
jgi:anti-anti-sigma factor